MKKIVIIFIALSVSLGGLYSQNKTIKGKVIDNYYLETLPYVSIMINDTIIVGKTDLNGLFQISIPTSVKNLSFITIGIELASIELADECNEVELVMMLRATYDFMSFKKIDKLRMIEFKKLPEIHKKAFDKGIFKTDKACYTQEFIPYYKR